jgi:hypothetical protein
MRRGTRASGNSSYHDRTSNYDHSGVLGNRQAASRDVNNTETEIKSVSVRDNQKLVYIAIFRKIKVHVYSACSKEE